MKKITVFSAKLFLLMILIFGSNSIHAFYDPTIGRFISRDPIGFADGTNQYQYCRSNPVNHVDPTGLKCEKYYVGLCKRNVASVEAPRQVRMLGWYVDVPQSIRSAVNAAIPDHHNVLMQTTGVGAGIVPIYEKVTRGFFADDFNQAVTEYTKSLMFPSVTGYVPGHIDSDNDLGVCTLSEVDEKRYKQVKNRALTLVPAGYHLTKYNCQNWASDVLR